MNKFKIEKRIGWLLLICVLLILKATNSFAGSESDKGINGGNGGGDTMGGQPSCRC